MTNEMTKFVEDLRDVHKGKTMWIVGTGMSIDDFPADYFDDKLHIILNAAFYKYVNPTFWHGHHELWRIYLRDKRPDLLERSIICYPFPGPFEEKPAVRDPAGFFKENTSLPYWLFFADVRPAKKENMEKTINAIWEKKEKVPFYASLTVAHTAIESAFLMGAKEIILVGCEHKTFPQSKSHGDIGIRYPAQFPKEPLMEEGTRHLAALLKEKGVTLVRYYNGDTPYYKKGYETI